ncbi:MAG: hypothetical protein U9P73_11995 [Candidatus Cloacimonadota bacterium]|nr:hypothetical protein [Candidatus Cloacimonadota bacterium]
MIFINELINTIKKNSNGKIVLIFLFLTLIGEIVLGFSNNLFSKIANVSATLDISFFYSADSANNFFNNISQEGKNYYSYKFTIIDTVFPIVYSLFLALLVAYIFEKKNIKKTKLEYLILLPFVSMFLDYIENITTLVLMNFLPKVSQNLIYLLTISSWLKWGLVTIVIMIIIRLLLTKKE